MPNKYFNDQVSNFFVDGAKDSGYMKSKGKGYGDGKTSSPNSDYNNGYKAAGEWFEGTKGSKGHSFPGEGRHEL